MKPIIWIAGSEDDISALPPPVKVSFVIGCVSCNEARHRLIIETRLRRARTLDAEE